jgi:hypothetical protein
MSLGISTGMMAPALAGPLSSLLDDNRGDVLLEAAESAAFTTALTATGLPFDPLTLLFPDYLPVVINGRVLAHPKVHNLYLDDNWDAHNPDAPTTQQLDSFTKALVTGPYLDTAGQYGVGKGTFTGSHGASAFCLPLQPPFDHAEFVEILAWVTCEVSFDPVGEVLGLAGLFPSVTGVPQADDDALYVVYLPRSTTIVDAGCDQLTGYHFFGAAPRIGFKFIDDIPIPVPFPFAQTFAFAVIPTHCADGVLDPIPDQITASASHEIVEASTDPLVGTGWINDSVVTLQTGSSLAAELVNLLFPGSVTLADLFSSIALDLKVGEAADICEEFDRNLPDTVVGPAPAFQHNKRPVSLVVDDPSLSNRISVAPYWSNTAQQCGPVAPQSTLSFGAPSFSSATGRFVTTSTPLIVGQDPASSVAVASVSYRAFPRGTTPPDYTNTQSIPVEFFLSGADGPYEVDFFATGADGVMEALHSPTVHLDNTPPAIAIVQPAATQYAHSATLTLSYTVTDAGSGVRNFTPTMDGATSLADGTGLASGQTINLLTELSLGAHTFLIDAVDNLNNAGMKSVSFSIIVTADSIKGDVLFFLESGAIKNAGEANSLLAKLDAAAAQRAEGNCSAAANMYLAFINELQAQSAKGVDTTAAAIMIGDAQYLIAHCP